MGPAPAAGNASSSPAATYITIPISGKDVIVRSIQNLSSSLSHCRPWSEFLSAGAIDFPSSLSAGILRLKVNFKYFYVNYAILTSTCAGAFLLGSPTSLIAIGFLYALWLVFFFCREDPMVVMGRNVGDYAVTLGLVFSSMAVIWCTREVLLNLLVGISVGLLVVFTHGLLRNTEGLYLDENDSVSSGLFYSAPHQNGIV